MKEKENIEANEEIKELVITRIEATPSNLRLSIGGGKGMTKDEVISHVKNEDKIGKQIIKMHLSFLKSAANGEIGKALASV